MMTLEILSQMLPVSHQEPLTDVSESLMEIDLYLERNHFCFLLEAVCPH